jgi:DNA-directed RNA polymerase subunit RPC12/RpoP
MTDSKDVPPPERQETPPAGWGWDCPYCGYLVNKARFGWERRAADHLDKCGGRASSPAAHAEPPMTTAGEIHCRHCGVDIRLVDGAWIDRETHETCDRRHEPPAAHAERPDANA